MNIKKTTIGPTEGDYESEMHSALKAAFPWIPEGSISHQTTFYFSLGTKTITVDGSSQGATSGRVDILLYLKDKPLAVLELKRAGAALDTEDESQGLSYARLLHPRPPLVVVSNGTDIRILETHTGTKWQPENKDEQAFENLVISASRAATHDLKAAISTLMNSNPAVWVQAVRLASSERIEDMTGDWNDTLKPFVREFLIPRSATQTVIQNLRDGRKLLMVQGRPLIGKSNVLRELVQFTITDELYVTLYLEADAGAGILQQLADILTQTLNWPVNRDEARSWLLRLSQAAGPVIVVAVDGVGLSRDAFRADIDDLSSDAFGSSLRLVLAVDEPVADILVRNSTGRKASRIGRRAVRIAVDPLDDDEFEHSCKALWSCHAGIMKGGEYAPELRLPWMLRSVMSHVVKRSNYANQDTAALIPPLLGMGVVQHARTLFMEVEQRRRFRALAQAVIEDSQDSKRPISLVLESASVFVVRRETLKRYLDNNEIKSLEEQGCLRDSLQGEMGTPIFIIRIPELLASEAASHIANELIKRAQTDAKSAALWLSATAQRFPLGDIIAAQAILDAARIDGNLPFEFIEALLQSQPRKEYVRPGTRAAVLLPGGKVTKLTFAEEGRLEVEIDGQRQVIEPEPDEELSATYANLHGWLILSYLSGCPFEMEDGEGRHGRLDPWLLLEVGTCPIILRLPNNDVFTDAFPIHQLPDRGEFVCHDAGIVEPITLSILRFLGSESAMAEAWIQEAVQRNSFNLLVRINIALRVLSTTRGAQANMANRLLTDVIDPRLSGSLERH